MNRREFMKAMVVCGLGLSVTSSATHTSRPDGMIGTLTVNQDSVCVFGWELPNDFPYIDHLIIYPNKVYVVTPRQLPSERQRQFCLAWPNKQHITFASGIFQKQVLTKVKIINKIVIYGFLFCSIIPLHSNNSMIFRISSCHYRRMFCGCDSWETCYTTATEGIGY